MERHGSHAVALWFSSIPLASDIALIPRNQPIRTSHQATDLSYGDDAAVAGVNWVSRGLLQRGILMAL